MGDLHPGIGAGETYKFQILNANYTWEMKADPMERQHEVPPNTASIVTESTYKWNDDAWMQHRRTTNRMMARSPSMRCTPAAGGRD